MPRRSTWIKLLVLFALAAVVVPLLAYALLVPLIARQQIESALHNAGFEQVNFELSHISPWGIEINGLVLDDWRIENATVVYTPASLWESRVQTVSIRGAEIIIDRAAASPASRPTTRNSPGDEAFQLDLPLDRVDVTDSILVIKSAAGQNVRIPIEAHLDSAVDRPYEADITLWIGDEPVTIFATARPDDTRVEARIDAPSLPAAEACATIATLFDAGRLEADGAVQIDGSFTWIDNQAAWSARMAPSDLWLSRSSETGEATNVGWHGGVLQISGRAGEGGASLILEMEEMELESESLDLEIESLAGSVTLTGLSPPATAPDQHLKIARLRSGEMIFREGIVDFRVSEQSIIEIERMQWRWLDGTLRTEKARIDPAAAAIDATVQAAGIQLKQLLELFADEYARGEGRINATLPVQVRGWRVGFGEGQITGVGGGTIEILDADEIAGNAVESGDRNQAAVRDQVAEALRDFEYDVLRARLAVEGDRGLMARMQLSGRGKTGARRGVNFEMNIDGLDQLLLYYLGIRRHLSQN